MIIAHGSRDPNWVNLIDRAVYTIDERIPMEIGFLELVPGRSIADGVMRLTERGCVSILVIPLFVTMGSTHLHEIQYALGLIDYCLFSARLEKIRTEAEIIWCDPLEDHPMVYHILRDRIHPMSADPKQEFLLLIGHGSEEPFFHERWEMLLATMAAKLKAVWGFQDAGHATLHPDNITERAGRAAEKHRVIVQPVFLSEGYFTKSVIPGKLQGISVRYDGRTILPHPGISAWIQRTIEDNIPRASEASFLREEVPPA